MISDFEAFHAAALTEVTDFLGSTFTYNSVSYLGIISSLELSNELVEQGGGLIETLGTQIIVAKCLLNTAPTAGQTLFIGTQKARIVKVNSDEVSYELTCITAAK